MPSEPFWIRQEVVIGLNRQAVEETGENHALLFPDRLEACIVRPQTLYHYGAVEDVVTLSVSLMVSIAQAHPFEQGNKRTGFMSGLTFLYDNGYSCRIPDTPGVAGMFQQVVIREAEPELFEDMLANFVEPLPE